MCLPSGPQSGVEPRPFFYAQRAAKALRPISDRAVAIFFAFLVAIVVLGYLLMTKLADDSHAENCMMEHRKNCGAIEWPSK